MKAWSSDGHVTGGFYNQFVISVQRADLYKDYELKTDMEMYTLLSKQIIPIQVKSSPSFARKFLKLGHPIPVVVVDDNDSEEAIRRRTIFEIVNMFPYLEEEIIAAGCMPPKLRNLFLY